MGCIHNYISTHTSAATGEKKNCEYGPLNAPVTEPTYLLLLLVVLGFEVWSSSVQLRMLEAVR